MGTSGCAAIRITIWETPGPRLIPYITRSCTSKLLPERRYSFVTKVLRVSPLKDVGIYDTEVRVKGDKWLEITFFVRLRHRVSRVFNLQEFWQCRLSSTLRQALIQFKRKPQLPFLPNDLKQTHQLQMRVPTDSRRTRSFPEACNAPRRTLVGRLLLVPRHVSHCAECGTSTRRQVLKPSFLSPVRVGSKL